MVQKLQGRKTYIVIIVALIYAIAGWYTHYVTPQDAMNIILAALGAAGFRSAMANQ